jgi:hypothetical protein
MVSINKPYDDCNACGGELTPCLSWKMCMCSVPKELRDAMELAGWRIGRSPTHKTVTSIDGTVKVLLLKAIAFALTVELGESLGSAYNAG